MASRNVEIVENKHFWELTSKLIEADKQRLDWNYKINSLTHALWVTHA